MSQSDETVIISVHFLNNNNKYINTFVTVKTSNTAKYFIWNKFSLLIILFEFIWTFYSSKNPEKMYHCFPQNIKQHNYFQHWS